MIVINFIRWFTQLISGFSFNFEFDGGVINTVMGIIDFIAYVLPLDTVIVIISCTFGLMVFRYTIALWKFILSLIPFAG